MASDFSSILIFPSFQFDGLRHSVFIRNSEKRKRKKNYDWSIHRKALLSKWIVNLHLRFLAAVLVVLCCKGYATYCGKA
ncbi:hypothetical protein V1478_013115 [Vespula squamosa]|uniref:Uncharacterized protein n=1 Tax=Vespula squamosa TaxID=30214 RepID=A0ABD2AC41_VESSQ